MHSKASTRRGSALLIAVLFLALLSTLVFAFADTLTRARGVTRTQLEGDELERLAENAATLAVHRLWSPFALARAGEATTTHVEVRAFLDGLGLVDQAGVATPVRLDRTAALGLDALDAVPGATSRRSGRVESLLLHRVDQGRETQLHVRVEASSSRGEGAVGARSALPTEAAWEAVYVVGPRDWTGLDYALLANNVNCSMCHMTVDDAERFWNTDPDRYGSFDRVKVGTIESLHLRDNAASRIHGTLYLGAKGYDDGGNEITDWAGQTVDAAEMDGHGHVLQDTWGDVDYEDLHAAVPVSGELQPLENLYLNYLATGVDQVDGFLPDRFPAIFPDDGGVDPGTGDATTVGADNRRVDPGEFHAATLSADGHVSGGHTHVVGSSSAVDTAAELDALRGTSNVSSIDGSITGSVYLYGTEDDPILLDGEVAIDGDLILHGYVKGRGTLKVSGNVYVPDSLIYADAYDGDGNRLFGTAADGTANALAIGAGGNVLVGDVFRPRFGSGFTTGDDDGSFSFVVENLAIFNRREWTKTQPVLPGSGESLNDPSSWTVVNPLYAGVDYVPRYYSFTDHSTVPIFKDGYFDPVMRSWVGREHPGGWSRVWQADPTDTSDPYLGTGAHPVRPVVSTITATSDWIDEDRLRALIEDQLASQPSNRHVVVDGTFYSNDSIFGIIGARSAQGTSGKLAIEGAVVAADVGLLAPVDLRIHYDRRGKDLLDIVTTGQMALRSVLWRRVGTP